jgi:hypothetical protein
MCTIKKIDENIESIINETRDSITITKGDITKRKKKLIDMSSFEPQDELNPKVWMGNKLINSRVRMRLLDIADNFFDSLDVDWVDVDDIILTGSLANYNWSKYSDFDIHILLDFRKVDEKVEFVSDYFNTKKKLWNLEHEDLKIYGFPVELYVQDVNEPHSSTGIYSLEKNQWIVEPKRENFKDIKLNKGYIKSKSLELIDKIDHIYDIVSRETDEYKIEFLSKKIKKLFDKIKGLRKEGLKKHGEYSTFNIIFKVLRRMGYIDKLYEMKINIYDKLKSLK